MHYGYPQDNSLKALMYPTMDHASRRISAAAGRQAPHDLPPAAKTAPAVLPTIVLVEPRALNRQCLHLGLERAGWSVRTRPADGAELAPLAALDPGCDLLLLSVGDAGLAADAGVGIEDLARQIAPTPLVLLGDQHAGAQVAAAIRSGARGYVPSNLDLAELNEALRFVLAGGTFVPASALLDLVDHQLAGEPQPEPLRQDPEAGSAACAARPLDLLTPRERAVALRLRQGKPNKVIAYELGIQESTVKVFVQRILAKLHAANRTEVAYLTMAGPAGEAPDQA